MANVLDGNCTADPPNRKWAGDISYIWTAQGWLYLTVILDLHSRRVVGCGVSNRMKKDLSIQKLILPKSWPARRQAKAAIFQYINGFYYARRCHSYLGHISPLAFEAKAAW